MPIFAKPIIFSDTTKILVPFINSCSVNVLPHLRDPFRFYTLCISDHILGNVYWLPTISMISLLVLTFLIVKKFTQSNTYSLLAVLILTLTNSFNYYAFSATYDQTWVALFFGSIYLLNTKYRTLAVIPFIISLGFRGLPLLDLPIIITQIIILDISRKQKMSLIIPFICVSVIAIIYTANGGYALTQAQQFTLDLGKGLQGLETYRMDLVFFFSALPLSILLYKIKTKEAGFILFACSYLVFQVFYLSAFTNLGQEPYRMFPLLIFIALGYAYVINRLLERVEIYKTI